MTDSVKDWEGLAKKQYRSPSQLGQYDRCPYAYYLARRKKVWERPAAWLAHGSAVHRAIELWEQSHRTMTTEQVVEEFYKSYKQYIGLSLKENPNPNVWFPSGPYWGAKDIARRREVGRLHVLNVLEFYEKNPYMKPWVDPDGHWWVEKHFTVKFGEVEVVGYVDVVIDEIAYDYKTGSTPGGDEQLATYAGALNLKFDIPFTEGYYFMAKQGKPTRPYDLTGWSQERLADVYGELDSNIKAEKFDPKPSPDTCRMCPVQSSCEFAMT